VITDTSKIKDLSVLMDCLFPVGCRKGEDSIKLFEKKLSI
jgi:hypothetical protein